VNRALLAIVIVVVAASLVSSKSSNLVISWKNPVYTSDFKFHRVLALGLSDKTQIRADFEDALAAYLASTGLEAIAANTILLRPVGTQLDLAYLREQIRGNQIEAVVVSRLIKVENTSTYISGAQYIAPFPYYNTFYGYYGTLYPVVYDPGYLLKEKKVRIETNLYVTTAPDGQLVWTGITDTFNPSDSHKTVNGLVRLVVGQMQKEQLW
jgi:hypothetical protein